MALPHLLRIVLSSVVREFKRIAGEIKSFSTDGGVAPKLSKRMDKFMLCMLIAGKKALADTGITVNVMEELDKTRCGVLIGSAMGGMKVFYAALEALRISYGKMNPFCVPFATTNMGSAILAMDLGFSFRQFLRAREFGSSGISSAAPMRHV